MGGATCESVFEFWSRDAVRRGGVRLRSRGRKHVRACFETLRSIWRSTLEDWTRENPCVLADPNMEAMFGTESEPEYGFVWLDLEYYKDDCVAYMGLPDCTFEAARRFFLDRRVHDCLKSISEDIVLFYEGPKKSLSFALDYRNGRWFSPLSSGRVGTREDWERGVGEWFDVMESSVLRGALARRAALQFVCGRARAATGHDERVECLGLLTYQNRIPELELCGNLLDYNAELWFSLPPAVARTWSEDPFGDSIYLGKSVLRIVGVVGSGFESEESADKCYLHDTGLDKFHMGASGDTLIAHTDSGVWCFGAAATWRYWIRLLGRQGIHPYEALQALGSGRSRLLLGLSLDLGVDDLAAIDAGRPLELDLRADLEPIVREPVVFKGVVDPAEPGFLHRTCL